MSFWDYLPESIQLKIKSYTPHPLIKVHIESINWIYNELQNDALLRLITSYHIEDTNDYLEYFYTIQERCNANTILNTHQSENIYTHTFDFMKYCHRRKIYKKFLLLRKIWNAREIDYVYNVTNVNYEKKVFSWKESRIISKLVNQEKNLIQFWLNQEF